MFVLAVIVLAVGYGQLPWWGILNHTQGINLDAAKDWIRQFFAMKNFSEFYKTGQGYILPLLPNYEGQPIWPEDPKLAIAKDMFKLALPAGHALPNQTKLAALIQDKIVIGKLFSQALAERQGAMLASLTRWYTPAETLIMATSTNAELLGLSGKRNPYPGRLGVVEEGALADLLLVDGNPIDNIKLIEDPAKNFLVIMKGGKVYKNLLPR